MRIRGRVPTMAQLPGRPCHPDVKSRRIWRRRRRRQTRRGTTAGRTPVPNRAQKSRVKLDLTNRNIKHLVGRT